MPVHGRARARKTCKAKGTSWNWTATNWSESCGRTAITTRPKKAERELPKKVDKDQHKGLLDKIGLDDSILDKLPGGLGDKKPKDIL
jgi:hypothetical protein